MTRFFDQDEVVFDDADYFTDADAERESLNDSEPPLEPGESIFVGVQMKCGFCGHITTPWPGHEACLWCGQRPKMPERGAK